MTDYSYFKVDTKLTCGPRGTQCFRELPEDPAGCLLPCQGLYADIQHYQETQDIRQGEEFSDILDQYESYKRGYHTALQYPKEIKSE